MKLPTPKIWPDKQAAMAELVIGSILAQPNQRDETYLVGGLEHFWFFHGNHHSNWLIFFQRAWNQQPDINMAKTWIKHPPGGHSELHLHSNVYFVLAAPCELQLHVFTEFDHIPLSKGLKPRFWTISTGYISMFCSSMVCFSRSVFIQRLLCATVDQ